MAFPFVACLLQKTCLHPRHNAAPSALGAGARPDEAVSWGKIRADAQPVKVSCDASIAFPLLISQTFLRHWEPLQGGLRDREQETEQQQPAAEGG